MKLFIILLMLSAFCYSLHRSKSIPLIKEVRVIPAYPYVDIWYESYNDKISPELLRDENFQIFQSYLWYQARRMAYLYNETGDVPMVQRIAIDVKKELMSYFRSNMRIMDSFVLSRIRFITLGINSTSLVDIRVRRD